MRVLAVDVGSTAVKAGVVDADGRIEVVADVGHPTQRPGPGRVEQDPAHWWEGTVAAVRACGDAVRGIDAVAVTGQMQDLLLVAGDGPVRPALLYSDVRATAEHEALAAALGPRWAELTGAQPDATNVGAKFAWLATHEPGSVEAATGLLLGGHSEVVRRLTGVRCCDPTTAATTGLAVADGSSWALPVAAACGPDPRRLPALLPTITAPDSVAGVLLAEAAAHLGLPAGLPVVHAAGDAVATTIGIVGTGTGVPYAALGTSGWLGVLTAVRPDSPGVIALPSPGGTWLAVGPLPSVGATVDWARAELLGGIDPAALESLATGVCAAAHGLVMLPNLAGSRVPIADVHAAGTLIGLQASTGPAELAAAVLEGVAHALRQIADRLGVRGRPLAVCGGGSASDAWCAAIADVIDAPVVRADDTHAGLLGAAACAWTAVAGTPFPAPGAGPRSGAGPGGSVGSAPAVTRRFEPHPGRAAVHRRLADRIDAVAPELSPLFAALAAERSASTPPAS